MGGFEQTTVLKQFPLRRTWQVLPVITAERQQIKIRNDKNQTYNVSKDFGSGWGNNIVSRNMACDGQEMEDHSVMTPPFPFVGLRKKERMLLLA